jgi:hypothetical protein
MVPQEGIVPRFVGDAQLLLVDGFHVLQGGFENHHYRTFSA